MWFDSGEDVQSPDTPGTEWSSSCNLHHWEMSGDRVTMEIYRRNLMSAETCPDFAEGSSAPIYSE
jgi:hypothetical protein